MIATPASAQPTLVFPEEPGIDVAPIEAALADAGIEVVAFAPRARALRAAAARARQADAAALDRVQKGLERARAAYLRQRWNDALAELDAIESGELERLARPSQKRLLWDLQLQRVLILRARNKRGDRAAMGRRIELALAVDPERRPAPEIYGPEIATAFAAAAAGSRVARPVSLVVDPPSARVVIDGVPRLDPDRGVLLAPGLHVIRASAPGREPAAVIADTRSAKPIELSLASDPGVASLASAWLDRQLSSDSAAARDALLSLARSAGAERVIAVARTDDGARARVVGGAGEWRAAATPSEAALVAAGVRRDLGAGPPGSESRSVFGRWWFWTAVGAAAAISAGAIYAISADDGETRYIVNALGRGRLR